MPPGNSCSPHDFQRNGHLKEASLENTQLFVWPFGCLFDLLHQGVSFFTTGYPWNSETQNHTFRKWFHHFKHLQAALKSTILQPIATFPCIGLKWSLNVFKVFQTHPGSQNIRKTQKIMKFVEFSLSPERINMFLIKGCWSNLTLESAEVLSDWSSLIPESKTPINPYHQLSHEKKTSDSFHEILGWWMTGSLYWFMKIIPI